MPEEPPCFAGRFFSVFSIYHEFNFPPEKTFTHIVSGNSAPLRGRPAFFSGSSLNSMDLKTRS